MNTTGRSRWAAGLAGALLGDDTKQRIRLRQTGFALTLVFACVIVMAYAVWAGFARALPALLWGLASLGGIGGAFVAIRIGWLRGWSGRALTLAQIVWSLVCCATGYVVAGPLRGAVFPILMVVLMFGMFGLRPRQVHALGVGTALLFGVTMALAAWLDPRTFEPGVELGHFLMLAAMAPTVSVLATRLAWLREQRAMLAGALEREHELAWRDELTGLANRRQMLVLMERADRQCDRIDAPYCLALIDLDHFKSVNDQRGHAAGDEALRQFAREAMSTLRGGDVFGRWGGEEFVLLLAGSRLHDARHAVERMRVHIERSVTLGDGGTRGVTLSAGVAEHRSGENCLQTLRRADAALYEAKACGRNQVVAA